MQRFKSGRQHPFRVASVASAMASAILAYCVAIDLLAADSPKAASIKPSAKPAKSDAKPAGSSAETQIAPVSRMTIHAVAAATSRPLPDVEFEVHGRYGNKGFNKTFRTNAEGIVVLEGKPGAKVRSLWFTARGPHLVPLNYMWQGEQREISLPERLELQFDAGSEIGGVVQDEAGRPIAGAKLGVMMPITWPRKANWVFSAAELTSDKRGRWSWSGAPGSLGNVGVSAKHPDYRPAGSGHLGRSLDNVIILTRGLTVEGRVTDEQGRPVVKATVAIGYDRFGTSEPETKTGPDGRFSLKNCNAGTTLVTVQAKDYSPTFQEVLVSQKNSPLDFKLQPGHILRVRIVDGQGKPINGVLMATDTWRGHRSFLNRLNSDAEGRIVWNGAPADAVACDFLKEGFMSLRKKSLTASDVEQVVTLPPQLTISGRVTDANTGKPIKNFSIRQGQLISQDNRIWWSGDQGSPFSDGTYHLKFGEPAGRGLVFEVVAIGYRPVTSRIIEPTEGAQTLDFSLWPGRGPTGILLLPDGKPAVGADVAVVTNAKPARMRSGQFDQGQNQAEVIKTDSQGRFTFAPQGGAAFTVIALHEVGYAEVKNSELDQSTLRLDRIRLRPWARVKGRVFDGMKPDAHREVTFLPQVAQSSRPGFEAWSYDYTTRTDSSGRFEFDHVISGPGTVSRVVITENPPYSQNAPGWQTSVDVHEGATTEITIGGTGRPVVGRVVLEGKTDVVPNWPHNVPVTMYGSTRTDESRPTYYGTFDKSGRFRIPDVPAGDYTLVIQIQAPGNQMIGFGRNIAAAERKVAVPAMPGGRSDIPLDLGEIRAKVGG